jgi:phosphate transport system permease protein
MAAVPSTTEVVPARTTRSLSRWLNWSQVPYIVVLVCATTIVVIAVMVLLQLYTNSADSRHRSGWEFLFSKTWDPVAGTFGALPFVFGTVVTSVLALVIAIPVGVGAAIFLAELAPRNTSNFLTFLIELLAAVPSVIYGLLGIFVLVPLLSVYVVPSIKAVLGFLPIFSGDFYGVSLFSASIVLSIMIVPFVISVSREVLLSVPRDLREAAMSLGATSWEATWQVVVPFARRGIMGSIFLALARALGETMAVTMVIGNTPAVQKSLLAPGYSIAAVIANEFTEATGDLYRSALIELGLVLFVLTIVINGCARLLILATTKRGEKFV